MIYFLQPIDGGPVKIGFTDNLDVRRKQLEDHYGCPLALLATLPGNRTEESAIHERFRDIRLGRTEQFKPTAELMEFIGRPLLVGANPETVEAMPIKGSHQKILLVLKADEATATEYSQWLQEFADQLGAPVSVLVDMAIKAFAAQHKLKAPPKRLKR